jgi:hypothetical protein
MEDNVFRFHDCGSSQKPPRSFVTNSQLPRDAVRLGYRATVLVQAGAFVHAHSEGDRAAPAELRDAGVTVVE